MCPGTPWPGEKDATTRFVPGIGFASSMAVPLRWLQKKAICPVPSGLAVHRWWKENWLRSTYSQRV